MTTKEIIAETDVKMNKTVEATLREFATVRTGRASTAIVDSIKVEYYGTVTPLKQLAAVSTPDARLIMIQPWDKNSLADIEKAILKSDVGIAPTNDGKVIRLSVPPLTQERRTELDKVLKKVAEEGRISLRTARHAAVEHIRKLEKDKAITEDEKFKFQEEVQKLTDKHIKDIDTTLASKEKEITG
ncbi:MAG: ribosome recycling factor [Candidatus Omnitrophica bacterium]|nr:ribosome recycling factor [Candidatus Omnitrophota bacterium]